ncbi:hypothetical protein PCG10_010461 [Penicillium crustosum]|uniref:F-box domain-containing protein n=1 Tax=Penicillium crustosum TaxID=36656 RepID=A0A9P5GFJ3_PENCR|nr:hypothetical protein PCG10_010461 [Penicillium crustosum]
MASQVSIFETLPPELVEMIFQYLRESPYSLSSLTLARRKFYVLGAPTLYSLIRLMNPASSEKLERTFHENSWLSSLGLELQVHLNDSREGQTHEPLLGAIVKMQNLESLIMRSVPLRGILDSTNHRLISNLMGDRNNLEVERPTQYAGQKLRSCISFRGLSQDAWVLGPNEVVFRMEHLETLHNQGATIESWTQRPLPQSRLVRRQL